MVPRPTRTTSRQGESRRKHVEGWGCGYRSLQTICSWVVLQKRKAGKEARAVPSIAEIQAALVSLGDKEAHFEGCCDWIGSTEVFLCLDHFYQVPCRILHASTGGQVAHHVDALLRHFEQLGSPVMMGGDCDASSKGILGVCQTSSGESHLLVLFSTDCQKGDIVRPAMCKCHDASCRSTKDSGGQLSCLVVAAGFSQAVTLYGELPELPKFSLDPHWYRNDAKHGLLAGARANLQQNGWISWLSLDSLMESSFYNLCLPLLPSTEDNTL
ncbi:UFM1 specific peptidase 1 isoform X2 [Rhipicephalus microplus]|uniref:UFM1 specific peptidase 1 isoform X2 n=1 Tax=Rhipicephalus microplus TaxID=6941 RepID=UPI0018893996|nr:uncharacterized protein LOC119166785 isoform X2 [Rhipicephalus microplus]